MSGTVSLFVTITTARPYLALSQRDFKMIAREIAESIYEVVGCSVTGFRVTLTVRSRSGKLTYEAYANYDPESGELAVQNPTLTRRGFRG